MQKLLHRHKPALVLEFNTGRSTDPRALLGGLLAIYGDIATVGYDGVPVRVEYDTVLSTQTGIDWMLYFAPPAA
jgi:hypothetical protein